jgi:hypothetical protein
MQNNVSSFQAIDRTSKAGVDTPAAKSAPVELSLSSLERVAGGVAPNATWVVAKPQGSTDAPNSSW